MDGLMPGAVREHLELPQMKGERIQTVEGLLSKDETSRSVTGQLA